MQVMLFGQLTDITGSSTIVIDHVADTDSLIQLINERYPAMQQVKYRVAVNKKLVQENTPVSETGMVALLPPFSGG